MVDGCNPGPWAFGCDSNLLITEVAAAISLENNSRCQFQMIPELYAQLVFSLSAGTKHNACWPERCPKFPVQTPDRV